MNETSLSLNDWRHVADGKERERQRQEGPGKMVCMLRHDVLYATDAALQLYGYGYGVAIADDLQQLLTLVDAHTPAAVVVDSPETGVALSPPDADRIRVAGGGRMPLVLISSRKNFEARMDAARAGVDAYFTKPVDIAALAERLDALTAGAGMPSSRVLAVCSDPALAAHYQAVLSRAGIEALCPQRPLHMLRMLDQFRPDALLVDVDAPGCGAADLTALVRQDAAFTDIPIILLSQEREVSVRQRALRSGADEFIVKPVAPEELVFVVQSRIERYRNLRGLIMRDRLTGLYNHTAFKEQLQREMARARRERKPLALAMLDLDYFKHINDTHGHPVGDQVLRSISRLMRQRLRYGDVVGRYGGEEFGVILPATTAEAAAEVLNQIRSEFHIITHQGRNTAFCASFSAGVMEYGEGTELLDVATVIRIADNALYQAKHNGRDRVEIASPAAA